MPGTLPAEWRFALVATHPTSPLSVCKRCNVSQRPRRNTAQARRHAAACERKCHIDQRGHAVCSAPTRCRRWRSATVQPTQHHRFLFASVVVLVSARGSASPRADAGEIHRQCFASVSQCAGAQILVSARLRIVLEQSSPACTCDAPPLRHPLRFYITPPFGKCVAVIALKLHFVPRTAARPHGFPNKALCKVAFAGNCRVPAPWHQSGAARCVVGQWPAASHVVCAPPTLGLAAARHWPARSARLPPKGVPSAALQVAHFARDGLGKFVHVR